MEASKKSSDQHVENSETAPESAKKDNTKNPNLLPDGSGTNREGGGSDQGQEDGGKSFDAG